MRGGLNDADAPMNTDLGADQCGLAPKLDHLASLLGFIGDELAKIGGRAQKFDSSRSPFWFHRTLSWNNCDRECIWAASGRRVAGATRQKAGQLPSV